MNTIEIVLIVWAVFSLLSWCVLALRKKEDEIKETKNSLFELLSFPGSVFLLVPIINQLTSIDAYPFYISIWLSLASLLITILIYYPIYYTINNSKNTINKVFCSIYLLLQLVYYSLYTAVVVMYPLAIDTELYILFNFISYIIPAFVITISQLIHLLFRHRFFIIKVDNPKFLKAMIYSFTLNLISSIFIAYGMINTSIFISELILLSTGINVFDALRICSYAIAYIMLIINFCTQYVTYKMRALDQKADNGIIFQEKLAYLQYSGYYVGFSYLSYSFNCFFIYSICVVIYFAYAIDLAMLLFVFGFVLSIVVPFIVFFMLRKLYQTIYGYSLYGRNYQLFSKHQMASIQNDNINSFWIFFTFFISILFGIYSFVNRGIVVPLLRLIFASTYPRSNSQGVLDIGYHLDDEHKALEMV